MKKLAAAAIAIGVTFAATPVAHADSNWIAMAISDSTGQIRITDGAASQAKAEQQVLQARTLVNQDPKRVAQVVRGWVAKDD